MSQFTCHMSHSFHHPLSLPDSLCPLSYSLCASALFLSAPSVLYLPLSLSICTTFCLHVLIYPLALPWYISRSFTSFTLFISLYQRTFLFVFFVCFSAYLFDCISLLMYLSVCMFLSLHLIVYISLSFQHKPLLCI